MTRDREEETGRYVETYPDEDFLDAISDADPPTTSNVADIVGCSYDLAYRRLQSLAERGDVSKTDVGGTYLWSLDVE